MADLNDFSYTDGLQDVLAAYINSLVANNLRGELTNTQTLAGNLTLNDASLPIQNLTPSGADRTVLLAPEAITNHHTVFRNAGNTYNLLIKDDAGAITFATLLPGETGMIVPVGGSTWMAVVPTRELAAGSMLNGVITPTVSANNLTVAIKTRSGGNPSVTDPVYVVIGGVRRAITAALSVTKAAATNWCNAGSAELATKEIDYFPYLIWNTALATPAVDIFFSRIPWGSLYSDFSATAANEKYAAINATAPNATDVCVNIGRFAATLSAGAGYTWSVPVFTAINLKQVPTFETRWLNFTPQITSGGGTFTTVVGSGTYQIGMYKMWLQPRATITTNGTAAGSVNMSVPYTIGTLLGFALGRENALTGTFLFAYNGNNVLIVTKFDGTYPGASGYALDVFVTEKIS